MAVVTVPGAGPGATAMAQPPSGPGGSSGSRASEKAAPVVRPCAVTSRSSPKDARVGATAVRRGPIDGTTTTRRSLTGGPGALSSSESTTTRLTR